MATTADAEVLMRLYEIRREETLRKARRFMVFDFRPKTLEELRAVSRDVTAKENAAWRKVLSYWEMAASFVLRGAVDPDLFLDSNGEGERQSVHEADGDPDLGISGGEGALRDVP